MNEIGGKNLFILTEQEKELSSEIAYSFKCKLGIPDFCHRISERLNKDVSLPFIYLTLRKVKKVTDENTLLKIREIFLNQFFPGFPQLSMVTRINRATECKQQLALAFLLVQSNNHTDLMDNNHFYKLKISFDDRIAVCKEIESKSGCDFLKVNFQKLGFQKSIEDFAISERVSKLMGLLEAFPWAKTPLTTHCKIFGLKDVSIRELITFEKALDLQLSGKFLNEMNVIEKIAIIEEESERLSLLKEIASIGKEASLYLIKNIDNNVLHWISSVDRLSLCKLIASELGNLIYPLHISLFDIKNIGFEKEELFAFYEIIVTQFVDGAIFLSTNLKNLQLEDFSLEKRFSLYVSLASSGKVLLNHLVDPKSNTFREEGFSLEQWIFLLKKTVKHIENFNSLRPFLESIRVNSSIHRQIFIELYLSTKLMRTDIPTDKEIESLNADLMVNKTLKKLLELVKCKDQESQRDYINWITYSVGIFRDLSVEQVSLIEKSGVLNDIFESQNPSNRYAFMRNLSYLAQNHPDVLKDLPAKYKKWTRLAATLLFPLITYGMNKTFVRLILTELNMTNFSDAKRFELLVQYLLEVIENGPYTEHDGTLLGTTLIRLLIGKINNIENRDSDISIEQICDDLESYMNILKIFGKEGFLYCLKKEFPPQTFILTTFQVIFDKTLTLQDLTEKIPARFPLDYAFHYIFNHPDKFDRIILEKAVQLVLGGKLKHDPWEVQILKLNIISNNIIPLLNLNSGLTTKSLNKCVTLYSTLQSRSQNEQIFTLKASQCFLEHSPLFGHSAFRLNIACRTAINYPEQFSQKHVFEAVKIVLSSLNSMNHDLLPACIKYVTEHLESFDKELKLQVAELILAGNFNKDNWTSKALHIVNDVFLNPENRNDNILMERLAQLLIINNQKQRENLSLECLSKAVTICFDLDFSNISSEIPTYCTQYVFDHPEFFNQCYFIRAAGYVLYKDVNNDEWKARAIKIVTDIIMNPENMDNDLLADVATIVITYNPGSGMHIFSFKCIIDAVKICLNRAEDTISHDVLEACVKYVLNNPDIFTNDSLLIVYEIVLLLEIYRNSLRPHVINMVSDTFLEPNKYDPIFVRKLAIKILVWQDYNNKLFSEECLLETIKICLNPDVLTTIEPNNINRLVKIVIPNLNKLDTQLSLNLLNQFEHFEENTQVHIKDFLLKEEIEKDKLKVQKIKIAVVSNQLRTLMFSELELVKKFLIDSCWKVHCQDETVTYFQKAITSFHEYNNDKVPWELCYPVLKNQSKFPENCVINSVKILLNEGQVDVPKETIMLCVQYVNEHQDRFDEDMHQRAALKVLEANSHNEAWINQAINLLNDIILHPENRDKFFVAKVAQLIILYNSESGKPSFSEECKTKAVKIRLLSGTSNTPQITEACALYVISHQESFDSELVLCAATMILSLEFDDIGYTAQSMKMLSHAIRNPHKHKEDVIQRIAKFAISKPYLFSPEVVQLARRLTYWEDDSKFCIRNANYFISISKALIQEYPERVLQKFYTHCYKKRRLESFKIQLLDGDFLPIDVVDYNGVSRQFITDLFRSLTLAALGGQTKLIEFSNENGCVLPKASCRNLQGRYRAIQPHQVHGLSDDELLAAANLAYVTADLAPDYLKNEDGSFDLCKVRENFTTIQMQICPLGYEEDRIYEAIGKIMGMCHAGNRYVIGQVFDLILFEVIRNIPANELNKEYKNLSDEVLLEMYFFLNPDFASKFDKEEMTEDILHYAYVSEDDRPPELRGNPSIEVIRNKYEEIETALRAQLVVMAKLSPTLPAIFRIAQGIASHYFEEWEWAESMRWDPHCTLKVKIQGQFSKDILKGAINCSDNSLKVFFNTWIDASSEDLCRQFIFAATGCESLSMGVAILITLVNDQNRFPQYHTCSRNVECPIYSNYALFKEKLEKSIEYALKADGYQFL